MNEKRRLYAEIILTAVFAAGGFVYAAEEAWIYAAAFLAAGLIFGYRALKEIKSLKEKKDKN